MLLGLPQSERAEAGGCEMTASGYSSAMILEKFPEVQRLSASEKLLFVSELWNDLEANPSEVPVAREIIAPTGMAEGDNGIAHLAISSICAASRY